jgi:hypothetical protein
MTVRHSAVALAAATHLGANLRADRSDHRHKPGPRMRLRPVVSRGKDPDHRPVSKIRTFISRLSQTRAGPMPRTSYKRLVRDALNCLNFGDGIRRGGFLQGRPATTSSEVYSQKQVRTPLGRRRKA